MRFTTFISLLIVGLACNTPKNATTKPGKFDGTWIPVKQEINGNPLPAAVFEKERLVLADSTYTLVAESVDKGVVYYKGDKMDIYGREGVNAGKHFTAIYKFENGQLMVCYNLSGDSYPTAFETKDKPTLFLSVFKKG